jgi:3-methyladenine DNA glycosylase AlkD
MAKKPVAKSKPAAGVKAILAQLEAMGNKTVRARNLKQGAGENQFGCQLGDIRKLADKLKLDHETALKLWDTGNLDARHLAALALKAKLLSADEMESLVKSVSFAWLADWLHSYVLKDHADKESLRVKWMQSDDLMAARAGWRLTAGRVAKSPEGIDPAALLDRLEAEMGSADPLVQWTMNQCLVEIGVNLPKLRKRAIAIAEKLGVFRDYPVSKGCTSPFAPIWIDYMVKRQK